MRSAGTLPEPRRLATAADLGKYRLIAELARGGMGVVHLAVVQGVAGFTKLLVVKELRKEFLDDEAFVSMFFEEARLAARLNHPNIVQTIEVGSEGSRRFLAMEYLEGQSLQRIIRRARRLGEPVSVGAQLRVLVEVLSALEYAHSLAGLDGAALGLVHRDVSPHNVLVTYEGHIKLVDFGIAKTLDAVHETRGGVLKGKTTYMAPEQAACEPVDRRADVFAVGLMLWEAAVGRRPWEGQGDVAILRSLLSGAVPQLEDARQDVDTDLAAIVRRATSVKVDERYPTALAMRDDLERYIAAHEIAPTTTRDLATLVSQLFIDDRQRLQTLIDAQLRALGDADREPISGVSSSPTSSVPSIRVETPSGQRLSISPEASILESGPDSGLPSVAPSAMWTPAPSVPPPKGRFMAGAVAALAVVAVVTLVQKGLDRRWAHWASQAATHAAADAALLGRGASRTAHVAIHASPASAQLYVDDVAVSNPYAADRVADSIPHIVRAEAPGYVTKTAAFALTGADVALDVTIDRVPDETPLARPVPAKAFPSSAVPLTVPSTWEPGSAHPPTSAGSAKPSRDIDTENPYAR
jgi:serine/threonine protein kinase